MHSSSCIRNKRFSHSPNLCGRPSFLPPRGSQQLRERVFSQNYCRNGIGWENYHKEFLKQILSVQFKVDASPGNANSQIGLPQAIFNEFTEDADFWIVEMGMSRRGEISQLCRMLPPTIALVTHVAYVHASNFDSLDQIAAAKGEILLHPKTLRGYLNGKSNCIDLLLKMGDCNKIIVESDSLKNQYPELFFAEHFFENAALARAVAIDLGISRKKLIKNSLSLKQ